MTSPAVLALERARPIVDAWEWWVAPWLAALVDGEGSVMLWRRNGSNGHTWRTTINVCNTDPRLINRVGDTVGVGYTSQHTRCPVEGRRACLYKWNIESGGVRLVAENILPFSTIKREQLSLLIEARVIIEQNVNACVNNKRVSEIETLIKHLNRTGPKPELGLLKRKEVNNGYNQQPRLR